MTMETSWISLDETDLDRAELWILIAGSYLCAGEPKKYEFINFKCINITYITYMIIPNQHAVAPVPSVVDTKGHTTGQHCVIDVGSQLPGVLMIRCCDMPSCGLKFNMEWLIIQNSPEV